MSIDAQIIAKGVAVHVICAYSNNDIDNNNDLHGSNKRNNNNNYGSNVGRNRKQPQSNSISSPSQEPLIGLKSTIENSINGVIDFFSQQQQKARNIVRTAANSNNYANANENGNATPSGVIVNNESSNATEIMNGQKRDGLMVLYHGNQNHLIVTLRNSNNYNQIIIWVVIVSR